MPTEPTTSASPAAATSATSTTPAAPDAAAAGGGAPAAPVFRYAAVTFDCPDPDALARFYSEVTGWPVTYSTDDFVLLGQEGSPGLGFNRLADYRRPTWPDPATEKQAHLDFGVADLDAAEAHLVALGATRPDTQPDPERWRVLLDPAGHPFCVSTMV
ncbi:VOC family protein [Streptomyces sp. HSW2009]|uniref:VOC family protein n=1 Tax=Streptomyces sp. HSW2009 TaxID=3142890 RepID=UPI0032EAC518